MERHLRLRILIWIVLLGMLAPMAPASLALPAEPAVPAAESIPAQSSAARQTIIFVPGINSEYSPVSSTPQTQSLTHFQELKLHLLREPGYEVSDFVDFSYAPDTYQSGGTDLASYTCIDTGQDPFVSGASLRQLIENVHDKRPDDEIVLVGHSLGGVIITWALDGLHEEELSQAIGGIITISSPLHGAQSDDLRWIYAEGARTTQCNGTGLLTDSFAATQLHTELEDHEYQRSQGRSGIAEKRLANTLGRFDAMGARVGTFGNRFDCIFNHVACGTLLTSLLRGT